VSVPFESRHPYIYPLRQEVEWSAAEEEEGKESQSNPGPLSPFAVRANLRDHGERSGPRTGHPRKLLWCDSWAVHYNTTLDSCDERSRAAAECVQAAHRALVRAHLVLFVLPRLATE
jgi:hypothetical protein